MNSDGQPHEATPLSRAIEALIKSAAPESSPESIREALEAFRHALLDDASGISDKDALRVLKALKSGRHPEELARAAELILQDGERPPVVVKLYVQGLVDSGLPSAAEAIAVQALAKIDTDDPERAELAGLLGRCAKDRALFTSPKRGKVRLAKIDEAIVRYGAAAQAPASDRGRWPRINKIALTAFRSREAGGSPRPPAIREEAQAVVDEIASLPEDQLWSWDLATACEAAIALECWEDAKSWLHRYVEKSKDAFELNSTLRQLTTLWDLGSGDDGPGPALLAALGAAVLSAKNGTIRLAPGYKLPVPAQGYAPTFEAVFGDEGPNKLSWLLDAIQRTKSVGRIEAGGRGRGSGFLIDSAVLPESFLQANPDVKGRKVLLTNAHVVSSPRYRGPRLNGLIPDEVSVRFEGAAILERYNQIHKVERLLWTSPVEELDCTILLLTPEPQSLDALKLTLVLPVPAGDRVYVIGYPRGGELSLSLQDTELIDIDRPPLRLQNGRELCRLRYTTPTEPGSSGSPVFSGSGWEVVALHHAGGSQMAKLQGSGFEAANEGIALGSILDALGSKLSS